MPARYFRNFFFLLLVLSVFSGCKTAKIATTAKARSMSTGRLIKHIEDNSLDYKNLSIRRINCTYEENDSKTSFKANLKSEKENQIIVSFSKLNIPVGRVLLTPDSIKYINVVDKKYFIGDYSFMADIFKVDLDFEAIEAILSNSIFAYNDDSQNRDYKNFTSYIDSGFYVIQSINKRKLKKIERKGKSQKTERILKKRDDEALILQTVYIEPGTFNPRRLIIEDKSNGRFVEFEFDNYISVDNSDFPGEIGMNFVSPEKNIKMKMKLSGFSTEPVKNFNFNIPRKYEQLEVN